VNPVATAAQSNRVLARNRLGHVALANALEIELSERGMYCCVPCSNHAKTFIQAVDHFKSHDQHLAV